MSELRIFKREFDGQNPDLISGKDLLALAIYESAQDEDFEGEIKTISDAFEYYDAFEYIQECDLVGELAQIQEENTLLIKVLQEINTLADFIDMVNDGVNGTGTEGYKQIDQDIKKIKDKIAKALKEAKNE